MTPSLQINTYRLPSDQGERLEAPGILLFVKAGAKSTGASSACLRFAIQPLLSRLPADLDGFVHERAWSTKSSELMASAARYKLEILGPTDT